MTVVRNLISNVRISSATRNHTTKIKLMTESASAQNRKVEIIRVEEKN